MSNGTLFIDNGGRIECVEHGGSYLRSAFASAPNRRTHRTPITTWEKVDAEFAREWESALGFPPACETCRNANGRSQ